MWILSLYKFCFLSKETNILSCSLPVMLIFLRSSLLLLNGQIYFSTNLHLRCLHFPLLWFLLFPIAQRLKYNIHFFHQKCTSNIAFSMGTTDKGKQSQRPHPSCSSRLKNVQSNPSTESRSKERTTSFPDSFLCLGLCKLEAINLTAALQPLNWMYNFFVLTQEYFY